MDIQKLSKKVGTHDGRFHADEVMATAILKQIYNLEVVRTRDPKVLNEQDIVYDVGGGEYDHHGVQKKYREDNIPYASCGLIWGKYGNEVVKTEDPELDDDGTASVVRYVDRVLIEGIDAQDNGIKLSGDVIPVMNISTIISGFNPPWYLEYHEDEAFSEAVEIAAAILNNTIKRRFSVLKSKDNVVNAYEKRANPKVLVLDKFCPWGEILQNIDEKKEVIFVVYPRKDGYAIQTVRGQDGEDRKKLPHDWAGKRDQELADVTGVQDAVFCHAARFMAVARSYEGIMKMAELAVNEPEEVKESRFTVFIKKLFSLK